MLIRHGSRTPGADDIPYFYKRSPLVKAVIIEQYEKGQSELCEKDFEGISNWTFPWSLDDDSLLIESGRREMEIIASRMAQRFPEIFQNGYNDRDFIVSFYILQ